MKDHNGTALSLEYAVLGLLSPDYKIAAWEPVNSLTWGKAMAWDLRGNLDEEIQRAVLLKTLTPQQVDQLYPPYPSDHPVIINKIGDGSTTFQPSNTSTALSASFQTFDVSKLPLDALQQNASLLDLALGPKGDGIGSNSWAVSGKLTATGLPILANDPHLSIQMPSIWYQMDMHCLPKSDACPYEMSGFSFAGVPGIIIGHNDKIAWGFTNTGPDVMDLFIEKVNPDNPNQYEVDGKWIDFTTRKETINVVGGKAVEINVRATRHGPVISDTFGQLKDVNKSNDPSFVPFKDKAALALPQNYVIALQWTALTPSTPFEAIWGFDKAQNWSDFRHIRQYRLSNARRYPHPQKRRWPLSRPRLEQSIRLDGLHSVRSTAFHVQPRRGIYRHCQQSGRAKWLSISRHGRLGLRLPGQPHRGFDQERSCQN